MLFEIAVSFFEVFPGGFWLVAIAIKELEEELLAYDIVVFGDFVGCAHLLLIFMHISILKSDLIIYMSERSQLNLTQACL